MKIIEKVRGYDEATDSTTFIIYLVDYLNQILKAKLCENTVELEEAKVDLFKSYNLDEDSVYRLGVDDDLTSLISKEIKESPLVLVFYLNRDLMGVPEIIGPYTESINHMINEKELNVLSFFIPTDGEERIDCINPKIIDIPTQQRVDKLINDIEINFKFNNDDDDIKEMNAN